MKNICIIGTGGFAREVLCIMDDLGIYDEINCFMEPDTIYKEHWRGKEIMGIPVRPQSSFNPEKEMAIVGIGDPSLRKKVVSQLPEQTRYKSLIHPSAVISKWATIGEGAIICAGCIITCQINIGDQAHLNLNTTIGHDCEIGDYFTTAPGVNISGICNFGEKVYFGTGAATKQGIIITDDVTIGMGAMVVKNIKESGVYVGIPAKKINK